MCVMSSALEDRPTLVRLTGVEKVTGLHTKVLSECSMGTGAVTSSCWMRDVLNPPDTDSPTSASLVLEIPMERS